MTTLEPGEREVLTYSGTFSPYWTAFLASRPAAINTKGLLVFVQEVIAAIKILPFSRVNFPQSIFLLKISSLTAKPLKPTFDVKALWKFLYNSLMGIISWGLLGPATTGTISFNFNYTTFVYSMVFLPYCLKS